jgi:hypothetical protein
MRDTQGHDCAVAVCCDRKYFPFTLFVIRQIVFHDPSPEFDILISSADDLQIPEWAKGHGIILHRPSELPEVAGAPVFKGKAPMLHRLLLARELEDRYRRILYLDSDLFVEGGDLGRLLRTEMGAHPIAAVLDAAFLFQPGYHAREYRAVGLPALPYANTGVQLIDTAAYREQEVERRSFDQARLNPEAIVLSDQSLTNLALQGKFAQLAPCWNWQWNSRFPLVALRYPIFLRHFIGAAKPDRTSSVHVDARFNQAYRAFLTRFFPEGLAALAAPCDPAPMGIGDAAQIFLRHYKARKLLVDILGRYSDPYRPLI